MPTQLSEAMSSNENHVVGARGVGVAASVMGALTLLIAGPWWGLMWTYVMTHGGTRNLSDLLIPVTAALTCVLFMMPTAVLTHIARARGSGTFRFNRFALARRRPHDVDDRLRRRHVDLIRHPRRVMPSRELELQILAQLRLRFADPDDPGLADRRARLRRIFASISDHATATALYSRLVALLPADELSREFHGRLHTATRQELLDVLGAKVRTPPAYKAPPVPQAPPRKKPDVRGRQLAESLPVHPNAWNDIAIWDLVREDLPPGHIITDSTYNESFEDEVPFVGKITLTYKFVPTVDAIGDIPYVLYYTAYNVKARRVEYAVGPALLPQFRKLLPGSFGLAGVASWYFAFGGHQREYQRQLGRAAHYWTRGERLRSGDALGKVYTEAAKDPRYWIDMVLGTLGAYALAKPTSGGVPLPKHAGTTGAALDRLHQTSTNLIHAQVQRSSTLLTEPHVFRHSLTSEIPAVSYARIEAEASMRLSDGISATYGRGVYAWPSQTPRGGIYIDIEVPAGVAVETIVHPGHGTFYRIIGASGETVPVKIVNTNLSTEQILMGRELLRGR